MAVKSISYLHKYHQFHKHIIVLSLKFSSSANQQYIQHCLSSGRQCTLYSRNILKCARRPHSQNETSGIPQKGKVFPKSNKTHHKESSVGAKIIEEKLVLPTDFERFYPRHGQGECHVKGYTENNTITSKRAKRDYLLRPEDLVGLPVISVFNPYELGRVTDLYLLSDVKKRSAEIWGSDERLTKEKKLRDERMKLYSESDVNEFHSDQFAFHDPSTSTPYFQHFSEGSGRVVKWAVLINFANFIAKAVAWGITGSHSLFAEMIHSLADTANQVILLVGLHQSVKRPDQDHPYGYSNIRYVSSLISGVGIFCLGGGLSIYHGISGLLTADSLEPVYWAVATLAGSVLTESVTLYVAANEVKRASKHANMSFWEYVSRGSDPHVNVVLLEDLAAVAGASVAGMCLGLTYYTGLTTFDSLGSIVVGVMLSGVAAVIIQSNSVALVGRSMPEHTQQEICDTLEKDHCVRSVLDVKTIDLGGHLYRFKAEIFFDGAEITKSYLRDMERDQVEAMLAEIRDMNTLSQLEKFMVKHGEGIVDKVGEQTKRVETVVKQNHPELKHMDLEAIGRGTGRRDV